MKKTLTINLSGSVFHIDDDAYEKLYTYLNKINSHFGSDADAKEIVEDIEARIAEIFSDKIKSGDEVINITHVDEVIVIMGTPEAISNEDEEKVEKEKVTEKKPHRIKGKRLYRDSDDKILGGVCSGLGAYFNLDPVIIRIIFAVAFFLPIGSSALIYLILWIVVPKASSTAQRLEMKGEAVNIDNISKSIKEEMHDVKENFRNYRSNPNYSLGRSGMQEVGNVLVAILKVIGTILLVIIGIPFLIIGAVALIVLFSLLFASHEILSMTPFENGFDHLNLLFANGSTLNWIWLGLFLVISVPLIMLIYVGIKMIFRIKSSNHLFGSIIGGIFIVGIFILLINGTSILGEFSKSTTLTTHESLALKSDTLYLTAKHGSGETDNEEILDPDLNFGHYKVGSLNGKEVLIGVPQLRIEKANSNEFDFVLNKVSRGTNTNNARNNAEEIPFKYQIKDSLVNLKPSFILPSKWRNQRVNLKISVPVGKTIYLDESLIDILWDVKNVSDTYDDDMVNKYWTMKPEGLTLVNRAVPTGKSLKK